MRVRKKIKISGIVSGKAFISYVHRLAQKFNLSGWIKNIDNCTNIEIEGDNVSIIEFMSTINDEPGKINKVAEFDSYDIPVLNTRNFQVIEKEKQFVSGEAPPQDLGICDNCREELFNPASRKYQYPFIACEKCGPKYSIINSLPFTRENSALNEFKFCPDCEKDIDNGVLGTNFSNCKFCGPEIWLEIDDTVITKQEECFKKLGALLSNEGVVLLKSTNCFYFASNAFSENAVDKIRKIKSRKDKPLTVMALNIEEVEKFAYVNEKERELLTSIQKPVVILKLKNKEYLASNIISAFDKVGVMLPYNALHHLIFSNTDKRVLVMSSANKSGRAIETDNNRAEEDYKSLVDAILFHDLSILNGSDDSVVTVVNNEAYFYRVARGYAPYHIDFVQENIPVVLACGGHKNSTIALTTPDGKIHISPYMGNLETSNVFDLYKKNILLSCKLHNVSPEYAICDMNPEYYSTRYVMSLKLPYDQVQHHYAHLLSCLVDNNIKIDMPVIGVVFDGVGLGDDQTIWGGEFFVSKDLKYERITSVPVFKMIGMNEFDTHIYKLGFSLLQKAGIDLTHQAYKNLQITKEEENMFSNLINRGVNSPLTSSAAKLFDGIAAILGIIRHSSYEEYSALYMESFADKTCNDIYCLKDFNIKNANELIKFIAKDIENEVDISVISAKFHNTLAKMTAFTCLEISKKTKIKQVVLTGSVWMNILLLEKTMEELKKLGLTPIIHKNISMNGEGLSVGQAAYITYKAIKGGYSKSSRTDRGYIMK